jgi:hypothetical protein
MNPELRYAKNGFCEHDVSLLSGGNVRGTLAMKTIANVS